MIIGNPPSRRYLAETRRMVGGHRDQHDRRGRYTRKRNQGYRSSRRTDIFAQRFIPWPGQANVEVNLVVIEVPCRSTDHPHHTTAILDHRPVSVISSRLDDQTEHEPIHLPSNAGRAFIVDTVRGMGFILEPAEAYALPERDPRNANCIFTYLNGKDLNNHPTHQPGRWVICFHN